MRPPFKVFNACRIGGTASISFRCHFSYASRALIHSPISSSGSLTTGGCFTESRGPISVPTRGSCLLELCDSSPTVREGSFSLPTCGSCLAGHLTRKNQVSNLRGANGGVTQRPTNVKSLASRYKPKCLNNSGQDILADSRSSSSDRL